MCWELYSPIEKCSAPPIEKCSAKKSLAAKIRGAQDPKKAGGRSVYQHGSVGGGT